MKNRILLFLGILAMSTQSVQADVHIELNQSGENFFIYSEGQNINFAQCRLYVNSATSLKDCTTQNNSILKITNKQLDEFVKKVAKEIPSTDLDGFSAEQIRSLQFDEASSPSDKKLQNETIQALTERVQSGVQALLHTHAGKENHVFNFTFVDHRNLILDVLLKACDTLNLNHYYGSYYRWQGFSFSLYKDADGGTYFRYGSTSLRHDAVQVVSLDFNAVVFKLDFGSALQRYIKITPGSEAEVSEFSDLRTYELYLHREDDRWDHILKSNGL